MEVCALNHILDGKVQAASSQLCFVFHWPWRARRSQTLSQRKLRKKGEWSKKTKKKRQQVS